VAICGAPRLTQRRLRGAIQLEETSLHVQPYLFFQGRADEAIAFYQEALGAKVVMLMRFKDNPEAPLEARASDPRAEKVMHARLEIGDSVVLLSDGMKSDGPRFQDFSLTLSVASEDEAGRAFAALKEGGSVVEPLSKTFFSPCFGMVTDRFGVLWIVLAQ
jgi:PhnB protein